MSLQEDLQQLDTALAAGHISADEYRARRDNLLKGAGGQAQHGGSAPNTPGQGQPAAAQGGDGNPFPPPFRWGDNNTGGEHTQVVRSGQQPVPGGQNGGAAGGDNGSESTQVFRPGQLAPPSDPDSTQVVPGGAKPGGSPDSTQVVRNPAGAHNPDQTQIVRGHQGPPGMPPPQWAGQQATPPWASGDLPPEFGSPSVWTQGGVEPDFSAEPKESGKGRIIGIVAAVVVLAAAVGALIYFLGFGSQQQAGPSENEQPNPPVVASSEPPPTPSSPPPPPRVAPEGPLADYVELPGEEVIAKAELPIQEAIDRNLPDGAEAQLLADNGGTSVLGLVRKHNETELIRGIWAFQADGNAGELLDAVDQFYGQAGHNEFGDLPNGVRGRYLSPPEDAENPIHTFRAHYVAGGAVIRVEAFGPDEEAAREAFLALLREQTTEHAPE